MSAPSTPTQPDHDGDAIADSEAVLRHPDRDTPRRSRIIAPIQTRDMCDTNDTASRTRVAHCKRDADAVTVYAGRHYGDGMDTIAIGNRGWLGNPFAMDDETSREEVVSQFREYLLGRLVDDHDVELAQALADISGETLGCYCQRLEDDSPACHAEVLADVADILAAMEE